jgi:HAE1 family hydrophobic/amphiphilic exporter-1
MGRHSVGTSIVGGMLLSTVLNLFFIPALYVILSTLMRKAHRSLVRNSDESVHIATS